MPPRRFSRRSPNALAFVVVALASWFANPSPVHAAMSCSISNGGALFGTINTTSGNNYDASQAITAGCTGGNPGDLVYLCTTITGATNGYAGSNGPFYMLKGSSVINLYAYKDTARTQPFTLNTWVVTPFTVVSSGEAYPSYTISLRIPSGQNNAPSGNYNTSTTVNVKIGLASTLGSDCSGSSISSVTQNLFATANNAATCSVAGTTLSFGSVSFLTSNVDANTSISVTCTNGTAWSVSLNGGQNGGTSATDRRMKNASNYVTYGLFTDPGRSQGFYGTSGGAVAGTGNGSAQAVPVYGRVAPQTTPPAATYSDTVVITVTF
jgi:spore coat protein U-like protein